MIDRDVRFSAAPHAQHAASEELGRADTRVRDDQKGAAPLVAGERTFVVRSARLSFGPNRFRHFAGGSATALSMLVRAP
jgi:hypothetical protein